MLSSQIPKRVVVAFPRIEDAAEWNQILSVRDRFDPLAGKVAPHLTLASPFEDSRSDLALEQHLRTALADVHGFAVTLRGVTVHEGEYLFLNVKRGNDALVLLHDTLYAEVLAAHRVRTHTFVPHVTIGRLSGKDLPVALDATSGLTSTIQATVGSVSVYRVEADGTRPVLFELPLLPPSF